MKIRIEILEASGYVAATREFTLDRFCEQLLCNNADTRATPAVQITLVREDLIACISVPPLQ